MVQYNSEHGLAVSLGNDRLTVREEPGLAALLLLCVVDHSQFFNSPGG